MTPERFHEVRQLFEAALDHRPEERFHWLGGACNGDRQLYAEVQDLLLADQPAQQTLTFAPSVLSAFSERGAALPSFEGRRVGQYDIIREIGRGGMGAVYLARRADNLFSKHVAFKVVRPERSDPELLRRFNLEREIVARLDHPNIARLLDGGATEEGLPYSVMEYVDGKPIDIYCDERRLNVSNRLKLVRTVCSAVQYAHQHLVVHRDLKPSNILVTSDGGVKLVDFGIAKLLGPDTEDTASNAMFSHRLLTLVYASPEQIKGERIATSSDVYSLGVILYELLTGRRPHGARDLLPHQITRAICEQEPVTPSRVVHETEENATLPGAAMHVTPEQASTVREGTVSRLSRRLTGELDNIVMTALRKEPNRRYGSVEQFSEDLRCHLSGLPVAAQPDNVSYRTRKFVSRHRVGVLAAAMVLLSMAGAVAATTWQARVAREERGRAERQATEARHQAERAERESRQAEIYRQSAEREARFAREQLAVADRQTRQAQARGREAILEREKAERRGRDIRTITAQLLELNAFLPDVPAGVDAGKRSAASAEQILSGLSSDGFRDPLLGQDVAATQQLIRKYEEQDAGVTHACPAAWQFLSDSPQDYECGLDRTTSIAGSSAYLKSRHPKAHNSSARLTQSIDAEPYHGKRIQLSARLKSARVEDWADIFAVVTDAGNRRVAPVRELRLRGGNEWDRYAVVFDVPANGAKIDIGFELNGSGSIWADNFSFEVVDSNAPLTPPRLWSPSPSNLRFEEPK